MILLSLYLCFLAAKAISRKRKQRFVYVQTAPPQPSPAEQRRRIKAAQERELAAADIDRLQAERQTYIRLLDAIEAELDQTGNQKRIVSLLSKQASIESKLHTLDRRIDRAYMAARS